MVIPGYLLPQALIFRSASPLRNPKPNSNLTSRSQASTGIASGRRLPFLSHPSNTAISNAGLLFREKLIYLEALNVDSSKVLSENPDLRTTSFDSIRSVENCLSSMGIRRSAVGRIFNMLPQLLTCDPYGDLYPFLDFMLTEVNIPFPDVRRTITQCPRLLVCSLDDQLRPTLHFLRDFGFVGPNAVTWRTSLLLVSSAENTFLPKIACFRNLGFSHDEVVTMVLRSPGLLSSSMNNNFEPKLEYFLKDMKGNLVELKRFPQYFSYSLEGKIKPRHQRLVQHGLSLPLSDLLKLSDANFNVQLIEMQLQSVESS